MKSNDNVRSVNTTTQKEEPSHWIGEDKTLYIKLSAFLKSDGIEPDDFYSLLNDYPAGDVLDNPDFQQDLTRVVIKYAKTHDLKLIKNNKDTIYPKIVIHDDLKNQNVTESLLSTGNTGNIKFKATPWPSAEEAQTQFKLDIKRELFDSQMLDDHFSMQVFTGGRNNSTLLPSSNNFDPFGMTPNPFNTESNNNTWVNIVGENGKLTWADKTSANNIQSNQKFL